MKRLIRIFVILAIIYLIGVILKEDFNFANWDEATRYGAIILSIIAFIIIEMMIAFKDISKTIKENDKGEPI